MGKVTHIDAHRKNTPSPGGSAFALCSCTEAGTPFNVVVIFDHNHTMTITGLVCPDCEVHVPIAYGQIDTGE